MVVKRLFKCVLLFILTLSWSVPVRAQREPALPPDITCPDRLLESVAGIYVQASDTLKDNVGSALGNGVILGGTILVDSYIRFYRAYCLNRVFRSEDYDGHDLQVITSFDLPEGMYLVSAVSDSIFSLRIRVLEGECEEGQPFIFTSTQAEEGGYIIYKSSGCSLELELAGGNWQVVFDRLPEIVRPLDE